METKIKKELVENLQNILEKNYDAEAGYKKIMLKAEGNALKKWLQERAAERSNFATEIDEQLRLINEQPIKDGSLKATVHRAWIDVKTALSLDTDESILEECIRGENESISQYESVLNGGIYNEKLSVILASQMLKIKENIDVAKKIDFVL